MNTEQKHPFCNVCGWRKGGVDSWDGKRCKCGHYAPPLPSLTEFPLAERVVPINREAKP
jgi:hypothetical protein